MCFVVSFGFFLFPPSVRMTLLNAFLHILAYMKNQAFQGRCCYECFMAYLPLNIYVNDSELGMCASRSLIYTIVDVFSSLRKCVIGCSVEAYPRWTYHSYAVKTSASHSSSEKRFWAGLKKKLKRLFLYLGNFIFVFLRFAANHNLQKNVDVFDVFLFLFLHYSILNCCMGQR